MKAAWFAILAWWLPALPATAADAAPQSARQVFIAFCNALSENQPERARQLVLSANEVAGWAGWKFQPAEYQRRVEQLINGLGAELRSGVTLADARLADTLFIPAGKKNRRALVLAVLHARFTVPGAKGPPRPMPFFLVAGNDGWRLWLRR